MCTRVKDGAHADGVGSYSWMCTKVFGDTSDNVDEVSSPRFLFICPLPNKTYQLASLYNVLLLSAKPIFIPIFTEIAAWQAPPLDYFNGCPLKIGLCIWYWSYEACPYLRFLAFSCDFNPEIGSLHVQDIGCPTKQTFLNTAIIFSGHQ